MVNGTHYFASQTVNACESAARRDVKAVINVTPAPSGTAVQTFCNSASIANLSATGTSLKWYAASSGGSALATTTALINGTHYFASQTVSACESAIRLDVTAAIILCISAAPTEILCRDTFLESLDASNWNSDVYENTSIQSSTRIVENTFLPEVTVFPNPSKGLFFLQSEKRKLSNILIYNLVGEKIYQAEINNAQIEIDLSKQPTGVYFMQITDENKNVVNRKIIIQ